VSTGRPSLRRDLPFRRIAVVLTGGGAMGAYEVGVLQALENAGIKPAIVAGVSVGAMNAVLWVAHHFRTAPLASIWSGLTPDKIGMRRGALAMRTIGAFLVLVALAQALLALAGSHQTSLARWITRRAPESDLWSELLDVVAWLLVAAVGVAMGRLAPFADEWLARRGTPPSPERLQRWFGIVLLVWALIHLATWGFGVPWPHRFSATVLLLASVAWLAHQPDRAGRWTRAMLQRLLPETRGRALWTNETRRRLLGRLLRMGDVRAITKGDPHLLISACVVDTGHMCYFVNWPHPTADFRERIGETLGEVAVMRSPREIVEAAIASSAVPGVFEPVRILGREFVDGGVFSNQPLRVMLADGADAILAVLVAPSAGPPPLPRELGTIGLGARLLELANWRDLQAELRSLPPEWTREPKGAAAARVCVVEPREALPGGMYGFDPSSARDLMERGLEDAWEALGRAGWLEGRVEPAEAVERS